MSTTRKTSGVSGRLFFLLHICNRKYIYIYIYIYIVPIIHQNFPYSLNKQITFFCISHGIIYFNRPMFLRPILQTYF
jgi:hypothetical protein